MLAESSSPSPVATDSCPTLRRRSVGVSCGSGEKGFGETGLKAADFYSSDEMATAFENAFLRREQPKDGRSADPFGAINYWRWAPGFTDCIQVLAMA